MVKGLYVYGVVFFAYYAMASTVLYFSWNAVMPFVFSLPIIGFQDSFLILIVSRIIISGIVLPFKVNEALNT